MNKVFGFAFAATLLLFSGSSFALPVFMCLHSTDAGGGHNKVIDINRAELQFQRILELGATGVRTDIGWGDVQANPDQFNDDVMAGFIAYFATAQRMGLEPMVILSQAPGWAKELIREGRTDAFFTAYSEYVTYVLSALKRATDSYVLEPITVIQMWNEANHIIDPTPAESDYRYFKIAGRLINEILGTPEMGGPLKLVNTMANVPFWMQAVNRWLEGAGEYIDVIGIDHYPGTWSPVPFVNWNPLKKLVRKINTPGTLWYGKQAAVLETGYSTWSGLFANETWQTLFIKRALPKIRKIAQETNVGGNRPWNAAKENKVILVTWYTLVDSKGTGEGFHEGHFGILKKNGQRKKGWLILKEQFQRLKEVPIE